METWGKRRLQDAIVAERTALAAQLDGLDQAQWEAGSLCDGWSVEDVVAHLTAAATVGPARWIASMVAARFDDAVHNRRRLEERRGPTPAATLARFRSASDRRSAASGHWPAWLGEVVVHGQDIRIPLGLPTPTPPDAAAQVLAFFVARDFAVASRSAAAGLRIEADDAELALGDGPLVRGPAVAVATALAGRAAALPSLSGEGVPVLADRLG